MATNDLHKNSWSADQMQARGFDTTFEVPATEMLGYDSSGNAVRRVAVNSDGELKVNLETADIEIGAVELKDGSSDNRGRIATGGEVAVFTGLEIPKHDYIGLGYTGSNLTTVTYKTGGSGGTTVATLTLAYSGSTLTSVTKS